MLKRNLRVVREGERTSPQGKPVCNRILLALPDSEFRAIRPHLEYLSLPHHRSLYEPNRKIDFLYFPNRGLISLVIVMEDGKTVEVAVLGREGFAERSRRVWVDAQPGARGGANRGRRFQDQSQCVSAGAAFFAAAASFAGPLFRGAGCRFRKPPHATVCTTSNGGWREGC